MRNAGTLWLVLLALVLAGCVQGIAPDGTVAPVIDPCAVAKVEVAVEGGATMAQALALFFPFLTPVAGIALGALGAWKKAKPKILAETKKSGVYYEVTDATVKAIEDFKKTSPATWERIRKKYLEGVLTSEALAVIKALRNQEK